MRSLLLLLALVTAPGTGSLDRFDFSRPAARARLHPTLAEASGLAALGDGRFLVHTDEVAVVYAVDPASGDARKVFALPGAEAAGDWEDVAVAGDRAFLVRSDGALLEWSLADAKARPRLHRTRLGAGCEVEGLAAVPERRALLLICKQHRVNGAKGDVLGYFWSLQDGTTAGTPFRVDGKALRDGKRGFSPSGATYDPATRHLILVAGPERRLAEVDLEGRVVGTAELDGKLHPQPEGIALADGRLLIADEDRRKGGTLTTYATRARQ